MDEKNGELTGGEKAILVLVFLAFTSLVGFATLLWMAWKAFSLAWGD